MSAAVIRRSGVLAEIEADLTAEIRALDLELAGFGAALDRADLRGLRLPQIEAQASLLIARRQRTVMRRQAIRDAMESA